jgi:hypothetical protein
MKRGPSLVLFTGLLFSAITSAKAQCGQRDTLCWDSVYAANRDSLARETRASWARMNAKEDSNRIAFGRRFGCSLKAHPDSAFRLDTLPPPKVGDTICQVLERAGVPYRESTVSTANDRLLYWYYEGGHLVAFRMGKAEAVVW